MPGSFLHPFAQPRQDEIMTIRSGKTPVLITLANGVTSGNVASSGVIVNRSIMSGRRFAKFPY